MDPLQPESFHHSTLKLSTGFTYHVVDQRPTNYDPAGTPTLLLVHDFPDLHYGWRHLIGPWVRAGYRVVAPDMLGYGGSDQPREAKHYTTKSLSADLAALLDAIGVSRAVVVGHDWGAMVTWRFAQWYRDRVLALIVLSIPFTPPSPVYIPPSEIAKRVPSFGYQAYFAEESSTKDIEGNLEAFLAAIYRKPDEPLQLYRLGQMEKYVVQGGSAPRGSMLSEKEMQYYVNNFRRGMHGPLSYYRTGKLRFEEERDAHLPSQLPTDLPVLFFWGTKDPSCSAKHVQRSMRWCPQMKQVKLTGCGHWLMVEARDEVNAEVQSWLKAQGISPTQGKL